MQRRIMLLLAFVHLSVFGQYIPFPTNNGVWVNHSYSAGGWWPPEYTSEYLSFVENFCVNNEDTLINSITYTKLNFCNGMYRGAIRDDSGQIFFVSKDSLVEMLLYDFTVDAGDTLLNVYSDWAWYDTLYVSEVVTLPIAGLNRKIIYLENKSLYLLPDYWIEGIGCSAGLLVDPSVNNNLSGVFSRLNCFSTNDSVFNYNFSYQGSGSCHLDYLSDDQLFEEPFNIYPNPANESVNLVFNEIISGCIQIFDLSGKLIFSKNISQAISHLLIDLTTFESGTYLVQLNSENGVIVRKLVVY